MRDPGAHTIEAIRHTLADDSARGVTDIVPALRSVSVIFDPLRADASELLRDIERRIAGLDLRRARPEPRREVLLPVCYEPGFAPDLQSLADRAGLRADRLIELHAGASYTARFLGFSPGFAYLEGLPEQLHAPRLESPRTRIEPGSVAIAGAFAGVYPQATPGGWRIIGRTPLSLFDPLSDPPSLIGPGDSVRFEPIDADEFARLQNNAATSPPSAGR